MKVETNFEPLAETNIEEIVWAGLSTHRMFGHVNTPRVAALKTFEEEKMHYHPIAGALRAYV